MAYALVALDTDRIKNYVFSTDRLREIRGASSILDRLNREIMGAIARDLDPNARVVYANGGSGLFLLAEDKAEEFVRRVQARYREETQGGATVTGAVQRLPAELAEPDLWQANLLQQLDLLRYKLRRAKDCPPAIVALPSHPLLQLCDSCGLAYAAGQSPWREPRGEEQRYCPVCLQKRREDAQIKKSIERMAARPQEVSPDSDEEAKRAVLWANLIYRLNRIAPDYFLEDGKPIVPKRPRDIDTLRAVASSGRGSGSVRDYLGLIYADGNGMGSRIEKLSTLKRIEEFASDIDDAIYEALASAVAEHLKPVPVKGLLDEEDNEEENGQARQEAQPKGDYFFPFDVLLLGGDDLMLLTSGDRALNVALEVARVFREKAGKQQGTLSVGVVFAPLKYPFGLMHDLAENALRFAKKQARVDQWRDAGDGDDTRINFLVVAGAGTHEFDYLYKTVYCKREANTEFRATLRPYRLPALEDLLQAIREAKRLGFPRSKLHQLREAVLKMNRTSTVLEALAALQGCRDREREFLLKRLYDFSQRYLLRGDQSIENASLFQGFPRVIFPWSRLQDQGQSGREIYLTPLLDLVELYDFVAAEEGERESED
ncbi:hypothetical protein KTAU_09310 [Thermogemmatispora aurantia]|uniref:Cas10/Cmr2 second palm domain-containing protein n=1 Tax=Thermogemmatispora aurantia TaxID=2045279 RepID=A0A5J4K477_9CHLR|nr:hypothetical protein [Thermogemmatispora aurantia]GER82293.1 hypothetical protein KTAU_09310 [Thermogemmatispora aurantia]